jgi:hypothetical protein
LSIVYTPDDLERSSGSMVALLTDPRNFELPP